MRNGDFFEYAVEEAAEEINNVTLLTSKFLSSM